MSKEKKDDKVIMPMQPIKDSRFIQNRIVHTLLELSPIDMNEIAVMNFTQQERIQFAQLIGYSLDGFGELSYVDDEAYDTARAVEQGENELEARNTALREQIDEIKRGLKIAAVAAFEIHPDDLK